MFLRTGILHVPALDEAAGDGVTAVLRSSGARVHLVMESSAGDDRYWIADLLRRWSDEEELDLIVTIGATLPAPGPSGREIVPDATSDVIERSLPGLVETMRAYAQDELPLAPLHRGVAGIRGRTLILNLPQGAGPACLFLEAVADLIVPTIEHLRQTSAAPALGDVPDSALHESPAEAQAVDRPSGGLSASEFAEYLRRSSSGKAGEE